MATLKVSVAMSYFYAVFTHIVLNWKINLHDPEFR